MKKLANNKYVVKYYDSNAQKLDDGTYEVLLLMEYCPNKSLLDLMNQHLKTKLSTAQILKIMLEISVAVSSMHYMNLIHRDLKVENVLINANNDFKLADFGSTSGYIAPPKNQEEFQAIAHDILYQTTPQYRAPEMIDLYKNVPIDHKSDIWALGVFLYKLMYYTTPFEAQGELAILHGYFQFPQLPKYPSRLKNLVIIMLQVDVNLRPNIYQVVCELCDIMEKEVPIKDYYGVGPYNFEEYAKYQQQLQYQQQQQQMQQQQFQQQQYQQQKYLEQEMLRQNSETARVDGATTNHAQYPGEVKPVGEPVLQDGNVQKPQSEQKQYDAPPQKLTRSTNPSTGDLQNLADKQDKEQLTEKTPDPIPKQPTGGYNEGDGHEINSSSDGEENLDDVEERYPSLEELDEAAVEKRFPDVDTFNSEVTNKDRKSIDEIRSGEANYNISRASSKKSQPHSEESPQYDESVPQQGIKLSKTEAWTTPAPVPSSNIDVDGVFHKIPSHNSQKQDFVETTSRKSFESGERRSFERQHIMSREESVNSQQISPPPANLVSSGPSTTEHFSPPASANQISLGNNQNIKYEGPPQPTTQHYLNQQQQQQQYILQQQVPQQQPNVVDAHYLQFPQQGQVQAPRLSPLQTKPQIQTQNNYQPQQYNQYDDLNPRSATRISRNPFPHQESKNPFPTSKSSLDVNVQPIKPEKSGGNPWAEYTQSPQQTPGPMGGPQLLGQKLQQKQPYSTNSVPKVSSPLNYAASPTIKITSGDKLIDLEHDSSKRDSKQPKLNLDLLELDISEPSSSTDDLKVEELKVKPTRKPSYANKPSPGEKPPALPSRKSSELSRINLDLEELDLDDENNENALIDEDETDDRRHSRRSLSLNRSASTKHTRSKSGRRKPEETRKSSFLGFRS